MSDEAKRLMAELLTYVAPNPETRGRIPSVYTRSAVLIERQATALAEIEALHQPFEKWSWGAKIVVCSFCCRDGGYGTQECNDGLHGHEPADPYWLIKDRGVVPTSIKPICATAAAIERAREAKA